LWLVLALLAAGCWLLAADWRAALAASRCPPGWPRAAERAAGSCLPLTSLLPPISNLPPLLAFSKHLMALIFAKKKHDPCKQLSSCWTAHHHRSSNDQPMTSMRLGENGSSLCISIPWFSISLLKQNRTPTNYTPFHSQFNTDLGDW
jgi:hypothetical protein